MSSLLDILHRKDSRAAQEPEATGQAADSATQTVELRLAVDNGPAEARSDLGLNDEPVAMPAPAAPQAPDPFATQLLTAIQLRQRSRRNSAWLGTGLVFIVVAAGVATWLLDQITPDPASNDSLFTATALDSPAPASAPASAPAEDAPPVSALKEAAAAPTAQERSKRKPPDTDWFDTPASEALPGASDPLPVEAEPIRVTRGTTTNPLFPKLKEAWTAFQAADYLRAETLYREVHAADANNVDALLGLGALAARGGRSDEARAWYQAVLLAEPKNTTAVGALSTLPAGGTRPLDESALKNLLREQPGAANLYFALGLKYVADGRWPDAQSSFFEAVRNEPTNADYAYNLAVSLDQLGQSGPATAYYQRALNLATASALFNPDIVRARLTTLQTTVALAP